MKSARIERHGCDPATRVESDIRLIRRYAPLQQRLFTVIPFKQIKLQTIRYFVFFIKKQLNSGMISTEFDCLFHL